MFYQLCLITVLSIATPALCKVKCSRCDSDKIVQFKGKYIADGLKSSACDKYVDLDCGDKQICAVDAVYKHKSESWTLITGCKPKRSTIQDDLSLKCTEKTNGSDKSIKCYCGYDNCNAKSAEDLLAEYKKEDKKVATADHKVLDERKSA